jgi:serine/threonine-protein kinase RsbW
MTEINAGLAPDGPDARTYRSVAPVAEALPCSIQAAVSPSEGHGTKREMWLPATPASARLARSIVREAAAVVGLDAERTWDLTLAATEALANAVEHGEPWPNGCVLFVTQPCPRGLRVEVCDLGSFDSTLEPAPLEATCGRGLRIVATLVDRLEITSEDECTVVRFEKHRNPAPRSHDQESEGQPVSSSGSNAAAHPITGGPRRIRGVA